MRLPGVAERPEAVAEEPRTPAPAGAGIDFAPAGEPPAVTHHNSGAGAESRLVALLTAARVEVVALRTAASVSSLVGPAVRCAYRALVDRGIAIREVYETPDAEETLLLDHMRWLDGVGGRVRTLPMLPLAVTVVDRGAALALPVPAQRRAGGLELTGAHLVQAVQALCEELWSAADAFAVRPEPFRPGLQQTEQDLLLLLARGHTDEAAARRLGVSLRTARRMMADLMHRLDARSRFQAGMHAVKRGWL